VARHPIISVVSAILVVIAVGIGVVAATGNGGLTPRTAKAKVLVRPTTPATGASEVVPWVDAPASSSLLLSLLPKPLAPTPPLTGAAACAARRLSFGIGNPVEQAGNDGAMIGVRNTGSAACLLTGTPRVSAAAPGHPTVAATREQMPSDGEISNTPPGRTVTLRVDVPTVCIGHTSGLSVGERVYHSLVISMPGGSTTKLTGLNLSFPCGMSATPFYTLRPPPSYPTDPLAALVPRLRLPATVRAGATLVYQVELINPANRALPLSPCPVYLEHSSIPTKFLYRLNCRQIRTVPANGSVLYEMEMVIPASAQPGLATVFWTLAGPTRTASGTVKVR